MKIKNRIAIVTGAASGLGAETAAYLKAQGAIVIGVDLQKAANLDASYVCDVTQEAAVSELIAAVVKQFGAIHIVINCAGIAPASRVVGRDGPHSLDLFNKVIQVNLVGTFNIIRLVAAQMSQQEPVDTDGERGVIINTASVAAFEGQLGQAAYAASKGAVASMTLPIARELARFGVRVVTIAPGIMLTPMMAGMAETVQNSLAEQVVFPKRLGSPQEYAKLAAHIVENVYLNASVIRLDGGIRMI